MAKLLYTQSNKRLILIKSFVGVLIFTILGVMIYLVFQNNSSDEKGYDKIQSFEADDYKSLNINDISILLGNYQGVRENVDGSIEAVLMQISDVKAHDNSFSYVLNIGTNTRFSGIGQLIAEKELIIADMIGDLKYSINYNKQIILKTSDSQSNTKYKLIQEMR
ncbi:MAG: hypothetical protein KIT33_04865 [Candidatus Kapabacteria bacterium]|nr:hypothetical protein [Ignavibacteriota bacterium]MCW5884289.1 hypothetical protein [Candidatus Kapabacteria bacterium]